MIESGTVFSCNKCFQEFSSRNKLFKHLKAQHSPDTDEGTVKEQEPSRVQTLMSCNYEDTTSKNVVCLPLMEMPPHFVYVLGGRLRGRTLNAVQRFSSLHQDWKNCPAGRMLENRGSHGAVTVDGKIYVVGGGGLHSNLFSCEMFDGKSWQRIAAMNVSRHALAVTSHNGAVYAVGGWIDGVMCSPATEVYDPVLDVWHNLPPLNTPRKLHGCAALRGKLYVFGGSCDEPMWHTDTAEVLDIAAVQQEQQQQAISQEKGDISPTVLSDDTLDGDNSVLVPAYKRTSDESLPTPINPETVQTKEERQRNAGVLDTRRSIIGAFKSYKGSQTWQILPQKLPARGGGVSAVTVGDFIYLFVHGQGGGVCKYDASIDSYSELSPLPVDDWHCFDVTAVDFTEPDGTCVQSTDVYVTGGTSKGTWSKVSYLYSTQSGEWLQLPSMPQAKRRVACSFMLDIGHKT